MDKEIQSDVGDAPKFTSSDAPRQKKSSAQPPTMGQPDAPALSDRVRVVIPSSQDDDAPVKVSYDGRAILIPRGKEVSIPRPHYEVLKDAVTTQLTGYTDEGVPIFKNIPRFAFTVTG